VIGQNVQIGSLLNFLLFAAIIGVQFYFMLPMFGSWGLFKKDKDTVTIGEVSSSAGTDLSQGITFSPSSVPSVVEGSEDGETTTEQREGVSNDQKEEMEEESETKVEKVEEEEIEEEESTENIVPEIIPIGNCMDCKRYVIKGRFTHYFPDRYPMEYEEIEGSSFVTTINCWQYDLANRSCVSDMASGLPWKAFMGIAVACPLDFPLGTKVIIPSLGREYICLDRGSMVCSGGVCDFDVLDDGISFDGKVLETIIEVPGW
jgi:hypothetical protein